MKGASGRIAICFTGRCRTLAPFDRAKSVGTFEKCWSNTNGANEQALWQNVYIRPTTLDFISKGSNSIFLKDYERFKQRFPDYPSNYEQLFDNELKRWEEGKYKHDELNEL